MEEKLRKSGIEIIGDFPWGTHFCQFYETRQDLIETLVPYLIEGLKANEYCMWVTSDPLNTEEAIEAMQEAMPNFNEYLAKNQIEIFDYSKWYTKRGVFDADRVLQSWIDKLETALELGYEGLRVTGNTFWLKEPQWNDFKLYEESINHVITGKPLLVLCTYSLEKCGMKEVLDVMASHEFALIKHAGKWEIVESSKHAKTELALRESEKRYRQFFDNPLNGFALCEIIIDNEGKPVDFVYLEVNKAFENFTGFKREDVLNKKVTDILPLEEVSEVIKIYGNVALTGESTNFEYQIPSLRKYYDVAAFSPQNKQFIAFFTDITKRKHAEKQKQLLLEQIQKFAKELEASNEELWATASELQASNEELQNTTEELQASNVELRVTTDELQTLNWELQQLNRTLRALSKSSQAMMHARDETEYLETVCKIIIGDCGHSMVWIGYAEDDKDKTVRPVVHSGFEEGYLETLNITWADTERGHGPTGTAIRTGKPSVCKNMLTDPKFKPWREEAIKRGYASSIVLPLMTDGSAFGALSIYSRNPDPFSKNEVNLLAELANDLAYGITTLRLQTARAKAEEEVLQAKNDWEKTFDAVPDLIAILDNEHKIVRVNETMAAKLGVTPEECIGLQCYCAVHGTTDPIPLCPHKQLLEDRLEHTVEVHEDNLGGDFIVSVSPLHDSEGKLMGSVHVARDITKRKQMEDELKAARDNLEELVEERTAQLEEVIEELEQSNYELQQFAYITSHDLQEPLRTIASYTQLLGRRYKGKFDQDADDFMDFIVNASARMKQMIIDLLEYSRVETQGQEFSPVNTEKVIDHVLSDLNTLIIENEAQVTYNKLPIIMADEGQLIQLFQNLISNAIKFKKENEPPRIHISCQKDSQNNEYIFKVQDNGIGMEPQYTGKIFEVFKRLHTIDKYEGTGIGLAVAKRIVERHNGWIWVESSFGSGSKFFFTIPST